MTQDYRYFKQYRIDRARGIHRTTAAEPVRAHVQRLLAAGASVRGIAETAGVSATTVSRLNRNTEIATIRTDVATKLQAVTLDAIRGRANTAGFVPRIGAQRRVQALLAAGWRHEDLNRFLPASTRTELILSQRGGWITRATHDAVCAAYDQLAMRPGPSERTRRRAAARAYAPALAWDEDTIDDPAASPDRGAAVPRQVALTEDALELLAQGHARGQVAERLGITRSYLEQILSRERGQAGAA